MDCTYCDENCGNGYHLNAHEAISNDNDCLPRPVTLVANRNDLLMSVGVGMSDNKDSQSCRPSL